MEEKLNPEGNNRDPANQPQGSGGFRHDARPMVFAVGYSQSATTQPAAIRQINVDTARTVDPQEEPTPFRPREEPC